jgi:hypothetical protein
MIGIEHDALSSQRQRAEMILHIMRSGLVAAILVLNAGLPVVSNETALDRTQTGNPLSAIPLADLSTTRDRPIFSPSRRPPLPVATAPIMSQQAKTPEPEKPQFVLVGTIAGDKQSFGIFLDRASNTVLKLKPKEEHQGWILREVRGRATVLEKDDKTATLTLPARLPEMPVRDDDNADDVKPSRP